MQAIVFDCEIQREILTSQDQERMPGIEYCDGWQDFAHMGISCVTAMDTGTGRPHVFLQDNLDEFSRLLRSRELSVGFNSQTFDLPLLSASGIRVEREKHFDIARAIWESARIPPGVHPKGLGLDAICRRAGIQGKTGHGAEAPRWFQTGKIGRLVDYCLADTYATATLYGLIMATGGVKDPRPAAEWTHAYGWLPVGLPL